MPNYTSKIATAAGGITLPAKIVTPYGRALIEYDPNATGDSFVYLVTVNDGGARGMFRNKHKAWTSALERLAAIDQKGPGVPGDDPELSA